MLSLPAGRESEHDGMSRLFKELKRRNVIRVGVAYVVAAWVLMQVVDLLAPILEWPDSVARIALYLLLVGFPIALLMSWFYQITPDGISLDQDVDPSHAGSPIVDQRLNLIVIALLCAAVILFAYDKWWPDETSDPSIAVLPFTNMSGLEENEYFSDGLTENLLHVLARNVELRVSARTSSFAFKDKDIDIRDIASELGVAHILEGSVQTIGDNVRITAQLIRASDGTHLWSAKYDRTLDDIFAIQDEIASTVGTMLSKTLLTDDGLNIPEGISTRNVEAFDLYLRAMAENRIASFEALQSAEELLKIALTKDPSFTEAKALLAANFVLLADTGAMDYDIGTAQAVALYEQVLAEQPDHVGARAFLLAEEVVQAARDRIPGAKLAAIDLFLELVNSAPNNVEARIWLARIFVSNFMFEEAIEQYRIAIKLDPVNPEPPFMLGNLHIQLRQWDEARQQLNRALQLEPRQPHVVAELGYLSLQTGDAVGYVRQLQKTIQLDPLDYEQPFAIAKLLYELELIDDGDRFREQVFAIAPNSPAAQALKIVRSIRVDSEEQSLAVARQLIRDDADNRRKAWIRAFRHLMLTAVLRERTQDELEFVHEYWPDFADWEVSAGAGKVGIGRAHTLEIWRDLDTEQGVLDRVDKIIGGFASINLDMSRVPHVEIDVLLLGGDLEGAIDAALTNLFSHSVLEHLEIKDRFVTPLYAEFVADQRIAAALDKWDDELAQARKDVRQYFATAE